MPDAGQVRSSPQDARNLACHGKCTVSFAHRGSANEVRACELDDQRDARAARGTQLFKHIRMRTEVKLARDDHLYIDAELRLERRRARLVHLSTDVREVLSEGVEDTLPSKG